MIRATGSKPTESTGAAWPLLLTLDGVGPLYRRIERSLRSGIRSGHLANGTVLPPSRELAAQLGCSRATVSRVYEQLVAEGYLAARVGSGTWVTWSERPSQIDRPVTGSVPPTAWAFDLAPGYPDLRAFPRARWAEASRVAIRSLPSADLAYPVAVGYPPLRELVADYLRRSRGVAAEADDVVICTGVRGAVAMLCSRLQGAGIQEVGVESPSWSRLRTVIEATGLRVVPIPVDGKGLRTDMLHRHSGLRAVVVTAAHQFPTGVVLAPERRQDLIDWARTRNGLILEDDYDAEFRYDRSPVGALQGLAPEHVVLLGSVSKTLSPAVGLGWYVMHWAWRRQLGETVGLAPSTLEQATFAELLRCGAFDRQLRMMRGRYRVRRDLVLAALQDELPQWLVGGVAAGLHLMLTPSAGTDLRRLILAARRQGAKIVPLSEYGGRAGHLRNSIVLGYGNLADQDVGPAVRSLRLAAELVRNSGR